MRRIRDNCRRIRELAQARLDISAPMPKHRSDWFRTWEKTGPPRGPVALAIPITPWGALGSASAPALAAEPAPAPL